MTHDEIAIEKQTPKEVENAHVYKTEHGMTISFYCPCCKLGHEYHVIVPNYCDNCGQRLDFEGVKNNAAINRTGKSAETAQ